jgi:hypothetical protein
MGNVIDTTAGKTHTYTDPFPGKAADEIVFLPCGRCLGRGVLPEYAGIFGGTCFGCNGHKGESVTVKVARSRESSRISNMNRKHREWAKRAETHNARVAAAVAAHPVLEAWGDLIGEDSFLMDLWTKAFDYDLSDKQVAAAANAIQRRIDREAARTAEQAAKKDAPEGRVTVTGVVAAVKYTEGDFGGQWKMLVKAEGDFTVWSSIPAGLWDAIKETRESEDWNPFAEDFKGCTIRFSATLKQAREDSTHAFASRPTKPQILSVPEAE